MATLAISLTTSIMQIDPKNKKHPVNLVQVNSDTIAINATSSCILEFAEPTVFGMDEVYIGAGQTVVLTATSPGAKTKWKLYQADPARRSGTTFSATRLNVMGQDPPVIP